MQTQEMKGDLCVFMSVLAAPPGTFGSPRSEASFFLLLSDLCT